MSAVHYARRCAVLLAVLLSAIAARPALAGSLAPSATNLVGEWQFDESDWRGRVDDARDEGSNKLDLQAYDGATTGPTSGGGCRYGAFTSGMQRLQRSSSSRLSPTTALTVSVWIWVSSMPADLATIVSKDINYEFHLTPAGEILWWWGGSPRELTTSGAKIGVGRWVHVAITYASGSQRIYVDGVALASGNQKGALDRDTAPFVIGGDVESGSFSLIPERAWRGYMDNVLLYSRALSANEVATLMKATTPCGTPPPVASAVASFRLTLSNTGLYCLDQSVTLTPLDSNGNAVSNYSGAVTLSTSTGRGTWLLQSGAGTFADAVADDGLATYTFSGSEASATFSLRYRTGTAVVNVDAYQTNSTGIRDTNTEGSITFSPSGFTVTTTPISAPVTSIPAFTASTTAGAALPVYLTAYGQSPTDATCGVIAGYTGAKSLKFWLTRSDPATGTIVPTVNATAIAAAEASAAAQSVTFSSGQATVSVKYKDVGRIAIGVKDDSTGNPGLPNGIRGSTGNFVVKPADFVLSGITRTSDGFANPGATTASGTVFIGAGSPFTATVTAVDAEGSTTPNYGRESTAEGVKLGTTLVLPASGAAPAVSGSFGAFSSGRASGTAFSWPEVGVIRLVPSIGDGSYLGTGDVTGTASGVVGRFIPARFEVATNTPVFQTACIAGRHTYVGQPFDFAVAPVATVRAVALGGTTTTNYTGTLLRLTNTSLGAPTYADGARAMDVSGLAAAKVNPVIADLGGGSATLTYSVGSGLAYVRTTPVAPFNAAVTLTASVTDADGVKSASNVVFGSGGGIGFSAGTEQRYGRLAVRSAAGSELLDLPVRTVAQYWLDAARGFTTATADSCTVAPKIVLGDFRQRLAAGETCVRDTGAGGTSGAGCPAPSAVGSRFRATALAGDFNLNLAAPGAGNGGAVTVQAVPPAWLLYDWNTALPGLESPTGLATFGVFQGPPARVYQREVY